MTHLQSVTCHMGSQCLLPATWLTQVNTSCLNPSQTGQYSIYLPRRDERPSWPRWLVMCRDDLPARRQSPSKYWLGLLSINYIDRSRCTNHYTMPPPSTFASVAVACNVNMFSFSWLTRLLSNVCVHRLTSCCHRILRTCWMRPLAFCHATDKSCCIRRRFLWLWKSSL